ncbi:MAG: hemerythrin domain-containing protein [Pseudomonadota bacterium]|nr:hemerythrin domain-containing protein [Pseudomonadota bacterium]
MSLSRLAPFVARPPADPGASFRACHERIRMFTAGLQRIAALPDLSDPRVPSAAAQARRYFAEGLPLHADDEDLSLAPRLRAVAPECGPLLDELERDHRKIDACLATLLPMLGTLAEEGRVPHATFRAAVSFLSGLLLPHIAREEDELFPLCARLSSEDRLAIASELVARRTPHAGTPHAGTPQAGTPQAGRA